ncbi:integrative conjugative element protein, RAQPRD family [Nitrogeniibacter aestuarii]|uniref:integrative conjugative element protein, RAQPRD family n=1 Tax=Nitrogeniibacter aestuarii TaxID=2815343 RepID=UPI001E471F69|nr:RAQPRD family integrative conjugative element protein [Nitrogeniibacter aestuarii]
MKKVLVALLCFVSLSMSAAHADSGMERENLARIQNELRFLKQQVQDAAAHGGTGDRIRFRYDWLARDLDLMALAIDEHLDAPRQPRSVPPLRGDYRQ